MGVKMWWTAEWRDAKTYQLIATETPVMINQRPTITIEETVVNFMNSTQWIPGKKSWGETTITYHDVENSEGGALFFHWMAQQYKGTTESPFSPEQSCVILRLYDGHGKLTESWYLENSFVTSLEFGEFSSTHTSTVEVRVKYQEADYVAGDPATWLKPLVDPEPEPQPGL